MKRRCARLLVVVLAVLSACGTDKAATSGGTTTAAPEASGDLVFFNPIWLPAGVTVDGVTLQKAGEPEAPSWSARIGRRDGDGKFRDVVAAFVTQVTAPREVSESEEQASRHVDVNGHDALASDSLVGASVSWHQDGCDVGAVGKTGTSDDVLAVARSMRPCEAGHGDKARLASLPDGMTIITEWGSSGFPRVRYSINAMNQERGGQSVTIAVTLVPAGFPVALLGAGHEVDSTEVARGHDAVASLSSTDIGGTTLEQVTLAWAERPDLVVSIAGTITLDDAQRIAAGLREESEQRWRSHLPVRDS